MSKYFIKCGKFFDGTEEVLRTGVNIIVEDDIIKEVGETVTCPADAQVLDLSHLTVTPGLIDAHVHLTMEDEFCFDRMYTYSEGAKTLNIVSNAMHALEGGFTTLRLIGADCPGFGAIDAKNAINKHQFAGSRLVVAAHCMCISGGHSDGSQNIRGNYALSEALEAQDPGIGHGADFFKKAVRKEVKYGSDVIKIMAAGGFASPNDDPGECELDDEELTAIMETAHQLHVPVTAHVYTSDIVQNLLRLGIDGIEHGSLIDEATCDMIEEKGAYLCCTFMPYQEAVHMDEEKLAMKSAHFQRKLRKYLDQLRESRKIVVNRILEGRMRIGYGTDFVAVYKCYENWREFKTWREEGIPALRTLRAATSVNAGIVGIDNIGRIAPGMKADISAWSRDIENDIEAISECDFVMKDGIIYKNI